MGKIGHLEISPQNTDISTEIERIRRIWQWKS
jgi:hypothetical protein